jgi:Ca-activated chloride channel homolog
LKRSLYIVILFLSPLLALSQFYLRGQVRDEAGNVLQNAAIYLHSNGYYYYSTTEGTFSITTDRRIDSITVSLAHYVKQTLLVDANTMQEIRLRKCDFSKNTSVNKLVSLTQNLKRETQQQWFSGDESYASLVENQFINATAYPRTGLTLNIDKASYSNVRRFLSMNSSVPPDAVRVEEMLNYFNFDYKEPPRNRTFEINATLTDCPWNKDNQLLFAQITSKKLNLDSLPQTNLVFLIDVSGSMDMPNRLPLLKEGFKSLAKNLRPQDSVSIVAYGGTVGVVLQTTGGNERDTIIKTIDSLQAGGSTPGESGIKLAYSVAKRHFIKNGNNRIILATDGDFNVGMKTDEELDDLITIQRQNGIYLTCLGIGMGNYKDSKIQTLAKKGHGNFAYIDSYAEAEKVLLTEYMQTLYTVADDAYLDIQFDPEYVKQYRVIGFDNKVGAIKDVQSTIEGGDIGSGYSSFISFEITPTQKNKWIGENKFPFQPVSFDLKYRVPLDTTHTLHLNESPEIYYVPFKDAPQYYRFASSVIMFGSLLRKSRFVKDVPWNDVLELASSSAAQDNYSQKEFVSLVQQAKNIYGKKSRKGKKPAS